MAIITLSLKLESFQQQTKKGTGEDFLHKKITSSDQYSIKMGINLKKGPLFKIVEQIQIPLEKTYGSIFTNLSS